jgi:hypothetical protein
LLTTESLVFEKPKEERGAANGAAHAHGGGGEF